MGSREIKHRATQQKAKITLFPIFQDVHAQNTTDLQDCLLTLTTQQGQWLKKTMKW